MSISQSLNNAISGLTASSRMAEVVSSNLSNALTEGYGRRVLDVSAASIGGQGAGVQIDGVTRIVDRGLIADRRLADAAMGGQERNADWLARIERVLGATGDPSGLGARLDAFESALINASADPASEQRLGLALASLGDVTASLSAGARDIQIMRQEADSAIARDIDTLNTSLAQVAQLNTDISRSRNQGLDPSALVDQRQRAIDTIAQIVPVREVARDQGQVALMTTSGEILLDGPPAVYAFQSTNTVTADMTLASGGLSGITRDGAPLSVLDGVGRLVGGTLGTAFQLRDDTLVAAQTGLDQIAADLITRFADPAVDPTLLPGDPGLLTDNGAAHDPTDIVGLAQRLQINASVDPMQGGSLTRWRDGVAAVTTGPTGNAAQLNRWIDALANRQSFDPGIPIQTASGQIARVTSLFATDRIRADEALTFASARRDTLYQAELSQGVDSDQELQNLLRIEQAYAANAKVVQTISAMIQTLMEI